MKLAQLLEQEGQPCSYCIAIFLLTTSGEILSVEDNLAYRQHLVREHEFKPYRIEP